MIKIIDMPADVKLYKHKDHDHFWIRNGILFEAYNTINGLKHQKIMSVPGLMNEEKCSESCLTYISKEFLNQ